MFQPPDKVIELTIDGMPFEMKECSNGASEGFHGAELRGTDGTRVRLVSELDGASKVVVFRPGAEQGVILEGCSRVEMKESTSRHSSSVRGRASVRCEDKGTRIEGTVLLERCS